MKIVLIVGVLCGFGCEFVWQYWCDGWNVIVIVCDVVLFDVLCVFGVQVYVFDIVQFEQIVVFGWKFDGEWFDVVVFVLGVYGLCIEGVEMIIVEDFDVVMYMNVCGLMQLLLILLLFVEDVCGVLVVVLSWMGSIVEVIGMIGWLYCVSKVVLNDVLCIVLLQMCYVVCILLYFGWVCIDMGGVQVVIDLEMSVIGMCCVIVEFGLDVFQVNGWFFQYDGIEFSW